MWRSLIAAIVALVSAAAYSAPVTIPAIAYHDIVVAPNGDEYAVTVEDFRRQMKYLKREGYTPIRLADLNRDRATLPEKPVLITFDDGLFSFWQYAYPILKEYGYPALLAIVTSWVDRRAVPEGYSGRLLTWEELRAVHATGNVEIISHSDDMHHGIRSNPQGNKGPAIIAREYRNGGYETEEQFRLRIHSDLTRSVQRMRDELKLSPIAIAWPYGQYDAVTLEEAGRLGIVYHFTLDERLTGIDELPRINRSTFRRYRRLADFDAMLTFRRERTEQQRFVEISLDNLADPDIRERPLSRLLSRLELLQVNAVIVEPFRRDGRAFFPNPSVPVVADITNRVIQQIRVRNRVDHIYARIPAGLPISVYRELARLNRFDGVIMNDDVSPKELAELTTLFRYYNPAIKIGVVGPGESGEFRLIEIDAGLDGETIQSKARAALVAKQPSLFMLRRAVSLPDEKLTAAMRALRGAGVRHYGYDNDDVTHAIPDLQHVGPELLAHTITSDVGRR